MKKHMIANWKMNNLSRDVSTFFEGFFAELESLATERVEIIVAPSFLQVASVAKACQGSPVKVAVQNICWADKGAFTGEVSAAMVKDAGVRHAIIGHSERRQYFNESDKMIADKAELCWTNDIVPIICVGETQDQRSSGAADQIVVRQLEAVLGQAQQNSLPFLIAYEPVWAIGTGLAATPHDIESMHATIRSCLRNKLDAVRGSEIPILYGGSVKAENVEEIIAVPDVDGALVGGASLEAGSFLKLVKAASEG